MLQFNLIMSPDLTQKKKKKKKKNKKKKKKKKSYLEYHFSIF